MNGTVIVAHKYLPHPDDELVEFLRARPGRVLHIFHSFPEAPDRCSFFRFYQDGRLSREGRTRDYRALPDVLVHGKELFFTVKWTLQLGPRWDRYIGMDGLCVAFGNLLRAARVVRRTVFWAIDFVPAGRFGSRLKNAVYAAVNRHSCTRADEMWDLSPRMAEARAQFAGIGQDAYRSHRVVPFGLWLQRLRRYSFAECDRYTVVFMGHLLEKQGVQLVVAALPYVLARAPSLKLKIIGDGNYRSELEMLARRLGVEQNCLFTGKISRMEDLEEEVARAAVAVAPYIRRLDTWTAYADPGKVKTYLACGVPVLLTDVPWNAGEIARRGCGRLISEDPKDIASGILALLDARLNQSMREEAIHYAQSFDWANIFAPLHDYGGPVEQGSAAT